MKSPARHRHPARARAGSIACRDVRVAGHRLRVGIRAGAAAEPPLLVFNGIGANFEVTEPLLHALPDKEIVLFDVPGTGGSPLPWAPYRLPALAWLASRMMLALGHTGLVDVLGVSWGGAPAQQFAFQHRRRCRRLVLAATSPGTVMVPGRPSVLWKMATSRRYRDPVYMSGVGAAIYGGAVRTRPELLDAHAETLDPPHGLGYALQLLATLGWSSLPWLWTLRQPTLVLHGSDDPVVPLANGRVLAALIPGARLRVFDDGHLFPITRAAEVGAVIRDFLTAEGDRMVAGQGDLYG